MASPRTPGLVKSALLFASGTFASRISGLVRDMVVVGVYGASVFHDAFLVAFRIPNLFREMVAEGALGNAFTKVFSSVYEKDPDRAKKLLYQGLYLSLLFSIVICALGMIFAKEFVHLMTLLAGETEGTAEFQKAAIGMTQMLFPYLGMTIVGAVAAGALHQRGRFFTSAVAPLAFNGGNIFGALVIGAWLAGARPAWVMDWIGEPRIAGLAIGVLIGGFFTMYWQFHVAARTFLGDVKASLKELPWSSDVRDVVRIMLPATIAASSGPIVVFLNTNFATSVGPGAVTWLNYSFRILQLPIGLFGVAVGVAVLPQLSRALVHSGKVVDEAVTHHLQRALELVMWLTIPCMVFVLIDHEAIIKLLFQHGKFSAHDALETGRALYAYAFGMIAYGLSKVFTSFYFAVERTGFAMRITLVSIGVNLLSNSLLVPRFGHVGLAITTSLTLSFNALCLALGLRRHRIPFEWPKLLKSLFYLAIPTLVCYVTVMPLRSGFSAWVATVTPVVKLQAAIEVLAGGTLVVAIFALSGLVFLRKSPREALALLKNIRGRRSR